MKKEIKLTVGKLLFILLIMLGFNVVSSQATTNYAISANKIGYTDNFNLGVDNTQAAIDETCSKFSNKLNEMKTSMYPVGSIYISTTLSTTTQVANVIGGTWEFFGDGKVLKSSSGKSEQTGGSSTATLTTSNLPSHTHSYTPKGSVNSSFTGSSVTTSSNSSNPTATFTSGGKPIVFGANTASSAMPTSRGLTTGTSGWMSGQNKAQSDISITGSHTHTVTAQGTVSSTFTGNSSQTSATGDGTSFSIVDPYITVYMYKRTK